MKVEIEEAIKYENVSALKRFNEEIALNGDYYMALSSPYLIEEYFKNVKIQLTLTFFTNCKNVYTLEKVLNNNCEIVLSINDKECVEEWILYLINFHFNNILKKLLEKVPKIDLNYEMFLKVAIDCNNYEACLYLLKIAPKEIDFAKFLSQALDHFYYNVPPNEHLIVLLQKVINTKTVNFEQYVIWFKQCLILKKLWRFVEPFLKKIKTVEGYNEKKLKEICETTYIDNKLLILDVLIENKLVEINPYDPSLHDCKWFTYEDMKNKVPEKLTAELFIILVKNQHYKIIYDRLKNVGPELLGFMLFYAVFKNDGNYELVEKIKETTNYKQKKKDVENSFKESLKVNKQFIF